MPPLPFHPFRVMAWAKYAVRMGLGPDLIGRLPMLRRHSLRRTVITIAGITLIVTACGSANGTSSRTSASASATKAAAPETAQASSAACQDLAALREAVANLISVKVRPDQADELTKRLRAVRSALAPLTNYASDASRQWAPQIRALNAAVTSLQTSVRDLGSDTSSVARVAHGLVPLNVAAQNLFAAARTQCPSSA